MTTHNEESNASLLNQIADIQLSTGLYYDASRETILDNLLGAITDLLDLYNNTSGKFLEIVAKKEAQAPKKKYTMWAYATDSYKSGEDAMASGGNWEISDFEISEPLTLELIKKSGGIIDVIREISVNSMIVYGHEDDVRYFITDTLEESSDESPMPTSKHSCGRILFEELDDGVNGWAWTQCPEAPVDPMDALKSAILKEVQNIEKWSGEAFCGPNVNGAGPDGDDVYQSLQSIRKIISA